VEAYVVAELFAECEARPGWTAALAADQHAGRRAELAGKLAALQAERNEYAAQVGAGAEGISQGEWLAYRQGAAKREAGLNRELAAIPAPPEGGKDWREMRDAWGDPEALELDERRAFLRRYIAQVTIKRARPGTKSFDGDRVHIDYAEL
jgi:hypothetical protein